MATRYEYYITGDTLDVDIAGISWRAQTFTPSTAHKITSVKIKLSRTGSPGTITVGIRATSGNHPTGGDLCVGTTNGNTLLVYPSKGWREITLGGGYVLSTGIKYAIVCRALSGDAPNNRARWWLDGYGTYAGGNYEYSVNSGGNWGSDLSGDLMFEDWGEPLGWSGKVSGVTDPAKVMGVTKANIKKVKGVA